MNPFHDKKKDSLASVDNNLSSSTQSNSHINTNIIQQLYNVKKHHAASIAAKDDLQVIDYAALFSKAEALALALQKNLKPRAKIALAANNHIPHLIAYLAIFLGGFVWVPLNPKNGRQLNALLIEQSQPDLVLMDEDCYTSLLSVVNAKHNTEIWMLDKCIQKSLDENANQIFVPAKWLCGHTMAIKFTGGSTGTPKGVVQSFSNVCAVISNMQAFYQFSSIDKNLAVAPITHGGSHYLLAILLVGGQHIFMSKPSAQAVMHELIENAVTISFMPPTLIYKLMTEATPKVGFEHLRHITYSAAPMPVKKIAQVIAIFGPKLSTLYGQTEAPLTVSALSVSDMLDPSLSNSVGKACKHSNIRIMDKNDKQLPPYQIGEIQVSGGIVTPGYYNNQDMTKQVLQNGWLYTGDLGYVDEQGYLFLSGRSKELIISGGFNVYPVEVENAICELAGVKECSVVGIAHEYWGESVQAVVCLDQQDNLIETWTVEAMKQALTDVLGSVKTPKNIIFVDKLPRNPVGKVVKTDIKNLIVSHFAGEDS